MDDDGQLQALGQLQVVPESPFLYIARRIVVIEIKAGFADGDHFVIGTGQVFNLLQDFDGDLASLVGMHPYGRMDLRILICQGEVGPRTFKVAADGEDMADAVGRGTFQNSVEVVAKLRVIQMGVAVNQGRKHIFRFCLGGNQSCSFINAERL